MFPYEKFTCRPTPRCRRICSAALRKSPERARWAALRGKAKSGCLARESVMQGNRQPTSVASVSGGVTRQQRRRLLVSEDICNQGVFGAGTFTASPRRRSFGQRAFLAEWCLVRADVLFGLAIRQVKCGPTLHARDFAPLRFAKRVMLTLGLNPPHGERTTVKQAVSNVEEILNRAGDWRKLPVEQAEIPGK